MGRSDEMAPMSESNAPRPGQVTLAAWLIILGSLAAVAASWQQISTLRTLDTRDKVHQMLAGPLAGSGASVNAVLDVMHGLAVISGACAAAAAILGWYALQRDRSARIGLTVLAIPLFFAGMSGGGFFSSLAAASVVLLWMPAARSWYAGVDRPGNPALTEPSGQPGQPEHAADRPSLEPAHHTATYAAPPMSAQQPQAWTGHWQQAATPEVETRRPTAVTIAAILTWVTSALFSASTLLAAVVTTANPSMLDSLVKKEQAVLESSGQGGVQISTDLLLVALWLVTAAVVLLAVTVSVFAVFAWRRQEWARIALLVCSGVAAAFFLISALSSPATVLFLAAAVATFASLLRPETRSWFARR